MSIWTHVAGVIRLDSLHCMEDITPQIKKLFNTWEFESPLSEIEKCNVPDGSEGSLQIEIWENPDKSCSASHNIYIFGDLRDYGKDDKKKFIAWWKKTIKNCRKIKNCFGIRNAVINIEFEDGDYLVLDSKGKEYKVEKAE